MGDRVSDAGGCVLRPLTPPASHPDSLLNNRHLKQFNNKNRRQTMYLLRIKTITYTFEQLFKTRKEAENVAKTILSRDKAVEFTLKRIDGGFGPLPV
jgi:hypothetical protein